MAVADRAEQPRRRAALPPVRASASLERGALEAVDLAARLKSRLPIAAASATPFTTGGRHAGRTATDAGRIRPARSDSSSSSPRALVDQRLVDHVAQLADVARPADAPRSAVERAPATIRRHARRGTPGSRS